MLSLKPFQQAVHKNAREKGFWEGEAVNIPRRLLLIISELTEAMEADRKDQFTDPEVLHTLREKLESDAPLPQLYDKKIKDSFEDELAGTLIRILDLAEAMNIDLETHALLAHRYNQYRKYKHGNKKY